jgi:hypothetical protein
MTNAMKPEDWIQFVTAEYLETFITAGGSSIKFAVPLDDAAFSKLNDALTQQAWNAGFLAVEIDAEDTRIHMVDQLFFRLSEQISWDIAAERLLGELAHELRYAVPATLGSELYEDLARENGIDGNMMLMEMKKKISDRVFRNTELAKEFRVAMSHICIARLSGGDEGATTIRVITDWLTGRNTAVSAVKPYQIFNRVSRNNARHLIESTLRWLSMCGYPGIVMKIDARRLTATRNPRDGSVYYTKAMVLDAYEVMRQFIDATDRLRNCLLVVVPSVEFLDEDPTGRGLGVYEALKFRIFDEIRDRNLVNPMASLVRLSSSDGEVA